MKNVHVFYPVIFCECTHCVMCIIMPTPMARLHVITSYMQP